MIESIDSSKFQNMNILDSIDSSIFQKMNILDYTDSIIFQNKKAWQHISTEVTVKGFKKCCISNVVDGTDGGMLWNVRGSVREIKGLCVRMGTVTLIGKGRQNVTSLVCCVFEIVKGNFHLKTDHSDPAGEQTYSYTVSLTSVLDGRALSSLPGRL